VSVKCCPPLEAPVTYNHVADSKAGIFQLISLGLLFQQVQPSWSFEDSGCLPLFAQPTAECKEKLVALSGNHIS